MPKSIFSQKTEEDELSFDLANVLLECGKMPYGENIYGNINYCTLPEAYPWQFNGNRAKVAICIEELSELPLGEDILGNIKHDYLTNDNLSENGLAVVDAETFAFARPKELESLSARKVNSANNSQLFFDINTVVSEVALQPEGQSISSNVQHTPLVEIVASQKIDVRAAILNIQNRSGVTVKSLHDGTGIIEKNSGAKAFSNIADDLSKILKFMVYNRVLYFWTGNVWVSPDDTYFITLVREYLPDEQLLSYLSTKSYDELYKKLITDPCLQVSEDEVDRKKHLIACNDGVIDTITDQILKPNPSYFIFTYSNISIYEVGCGKGEVFESFICNCTGGNQRIRQLILEMIGVILSGYTPKVLFLLLGDKNTGKTQFTQFLRLLIGEKNSESVQSLNEFSERWTTGRLPGKKLCICPDVPKETIKAQAIASIKQLVGGDLVSADQKYKAPFSFVNEAKLVFASNHKLQISEVESEGAFLDRIITIPFNNSIPKEKVIPDICNLLIHEKGYIVEKSIEALKYLQSRNFVFTDLEISNFYEDSQSITDSIITFCEENCIFSPNLESATCELYDAYFDFCSELGMQAEKIAVFARTLSKYYSNLERTRKANNSDRRGFRGIALK